MTWATAAVLPVAALVAFVYWYVHRPPLVVRELPAEASDIHYLDRDMFPDWSFSMSAALPEEACRAYVDAVHDDLEAFDGSAVIASIGEEEASWAFGWGRRDDDRVPDPERRGWWHPSPVDAHPTWYANNGGAWELVQCSQGRVFYESFSH